MLVAKRYELGPSIGRGGMGEVFRATDQVLGRPVAVKLLLPSDRDPQGAERFHREARAAALLSDPHVVSVYDFGRHDESFFLVMELVEGRTVSAELTEHGPLPMDRATDIVEQAAAGLAAAHRADVVHRDVKPGNLLVAADGTVKVADFGIAHLPGQGATTLTATGQIIGSSHYLAPERARGGRAGKPSDVYSLGCVLYQLVTGRPPFTGEQPTAILYQHVDAAPEPPSLTRPELAGPFEAVLLQMLAKDPADRPTAAEIAAGALRAQPLGDDWRAVAAVPAAATVAAATVPAAPVEAAPVAGQPAAAERPPRRRSRALLAGVTAALATTAAVLAGVALYGNEPKVPTTDVSPQPETTPKPGASLSTPGPSTTTTSTVGGTQTAPPNQANPTGSVQPSQSTGQQEVTATPSPGSTTSTSTTSPSVPPETSTTPSTPVESSTTPTPSTEPTPSDDPPTSTTPSPDTSTTTPPAEGTPTPDRENRSTPTPSN
ncbi:serine/threonine protein kinase [Kribbella flavida DSM 17836]|uniref:non-specific serine/threonine protein kinase n=1 Tax=Kribbella flavida (strain DSM 17836 / JCM 10339 / NBRC 14399) TaxID=479435 RepID=D2PR45_KRIFD|nr:serine/threonine-protein kinase [Kribbella flavida]ADB32993.1 serine/threonine protein kinase [Kribbella flavida DSM 17836]